MFCIRLKELRKEKGVTQKDFSKFFKIASGTIAMWEVGKREPDFETVKKIADYFKVSIDYLLGRSDIRNPEEDQDKITIWGLDDKIYHHLSELPEEGKEDLIKYIELLKLKYGKD